MDILEDHAISIFTVKIRNWLGYVSRLQRRWQLRSREAEDEIEFGLGQYKWWTPVLTMYNGLVWVLSPLPLPWITVISSFATCLCNPAPRPFQHWRWRQQVYLKHSYPPAGLYGVTTQNTLSSHCLKTYIRKLHPLTAKPQHRAVC